MKLAELAQLIGAKIECSDQSCHPDAIVVQRISPIETAQEGEITFVSNPEYHKYLKTTKADAVIVKEFVPDCKIPQLVHPNPYLAFAKTAQIFYQRPRGPIGVADETFIASDATLGADVTVYPFVFIGSRAKIGDNVVLYPGVYIGEDVEVGAYSVLYPNVVVYHDCVLGSHVTIHAGAVIGADGFGYAVGDGEVVKVPQTGRVVIEDKVEIGAGTTIDRAAMGETRIGEDTKIDNQCQIGHNVKVGKRCMLSAFAGLAGSCCLGDDVVMGGHSGVSGHIEITSGVRLGAMTGVIKSIDQPGDYLGFPAIPAQDWKRQQVLLKKLKGLERRLKTLETKAAAKE